MPCAHAALRIPRKLLTEITKHHGPEFVKIGVRPGSVDWFFDKHHIEVKDVINDPADYDFDDDQEDDDYQYPKYRKLLEQVVTEVDHLRERWEELEDHLPPTLFSVSMKSDAMDTILQIAKIINAPSNPAAVRMSGGTPDYHVVRYCTDSGLMRNDIVTILGASNTNTGEFSKYEVLPEFALQDRDTNPFPIWLASRAYDDYTNDEIVDDDDKVDDVDIDEE